jgi:tetratricopeptide (TPR) repeat protein
LDLARAKLGLTLEAEKPENFVQAYEDVLKLSPKDKDASFGLGRLRFLSGNFAAAENHFRIACSDSKDAMALAQFGRTLVELKKLDEAAPVLQKAIDFGNEDAAIRYDLARIRMEKGDLDWAESIIKDLAKKSPKDPEPLFWQGQIAIKRQQGPVAEEFFRSANRLQPMVGRYAEALATLSRDRDDFKMAMLSLNQAQADLTPSGRLLWADCLAHEGDGSKAMEVYTELYKRHPSDLLLAKRMDLWVKLGRPEQAVGLLTGSPLKAAVAVQFSLAKAQLALATARILKGDLDLAEDLLNKVVKSNSHNPEYHYYLGRVYFGQNRMKKARDEFIAALLYRMDFPDALLHQGLCQLKLDELMDAENSFGELSQHAEPIWKARGYYGLALLFEQKGKMDAVAGHLERSITIWPLPESMVHMSRIRLKEGKVVEAEELAKKSLMADPNSEDATVALAQALAAGKRQNEAMELAQQGLRARPLSCGLLVQSAKLTFDAGKLDSALAVSSNAIRICPEEPMGYYYAGVATHGINRPKEAKQYFKSFKKLGGDEKLVPGR